MSKNKCEVCGATCDEEKCFRHKPRKPMPKIGKKKGLFTDEQRQDLQDIIKTSTLFIDMWDRKPHKSEISGQYLGEEALNIFFHHILPKNKYREAQIDEENIIIISFEEHQKVEQDMYFYEEINKRREQLKIKYGL